MRCERLHVCAVPVVVEDGVEQFAEAIASGMPCRHSLIIGGTGRG